LFRRRTINVQDAVLVLLPEGVFHCKRLSDGNRRTIRYIEYKDLHKITLKISKGGEILIPIEIGVAAFDLDALDHCSFQENRPVPQIFGRFEFQFHYANGTKTTWFPPKGYEKKLYEIAQWILVDYRAFILKMRKSIIREPY